jgi:hypothetical protein
MSRLSLIFPGDRGGTPVRHGARLRTSCEGPPTSHRRNRTPEPDPDIATHMIREAQNFFGSREPLVKPAGKRGESEFRLLSHELQRELLHNV